MKDSRDMASKLDKKEVEQIRAVLEKADKEGKTHMGIAIALKEAGFGLLSK
jgi:hypothetical protein